MRKWIIPFKISLIILFSLIGVSLAIKELWFTTGIIGCILIALGFSLYHDQRKILKQMEYMISSIHHGDVNFTFSTRGVKEENNLTKLMNEALQAFRSRLYHQVTAETEAEAWQKLIRVLTHEIMNSVAPIISLSETVSERAEENGMNQRDYEIMLQSIQTIHRRSKGLLEFVENYRKLTRIPDPVLSPFPIRTLLQNIISLIPSTRVKIIYEIIPEDLMIYADRSLIEQVLINLIKNAVEASTSQTTPEVKIKAFHKEGHPLISISDNGTDILPEVMDRIFVPFFTTKQGGSGIGLSLCRQIMNRHGGIITVESELEKGTVFTLSFPSTYLNR